MPEAEIFKRLKHAVEVCQDAAARFHHKQRPGRVHNIRRSAAQMNETRGRSDFFLQGGQEGDDVVPGDGFNLVDAGCVDVGLGPDFRHIGGRDDALLVPGFAYGQSTLSHAR